MPVSLARRIRRIGLLPSTKDDKGKVVRHHDTLTPEQHEEVAKQLRLNALACRLTAFQKQVKQVPAKNRRSKSRRKAADKKAV